MDELERDVVLWRGHMLLSEGSTPSLGTYISHLVILGT
jgi:hypothetical protein